MAQVIQFEGATHEFPDDFTDADIGKALNKVSTPAGQANRALAGTGLSVSGPKPPIDPALQPWEVPPGGMPENGNAVVGAGKQVLRALASPVNGLVSAPSQIADYARGLVGPHKIEPHTVEGNPLEQAQGNAMASAMAIPGSGSALKQGAQSAVNAVRSAATKPRGPVGPVLTAVGDAVPIPAVKLGTSLANVGKKFNEWRNGPEPVPYPAGKGTGTKYGGPAAPFDEGASRLPPRTPAELPPDELGAVPPVDVKFTPSAVTKRNMPRYGGPTDESASVSARNRPRQGVNRAMEPEPEPEAPVTAKPPGLKWNPKPKAEGKPKPTKSEPAATVETKPAQRPPASEQAYPAPEGSEPNYSAPKEHYMKQARTVRGKALSRLFRDEPEKYQGWQKWEPGDARWKEAGEGAGVTVPNSPESIQAVHDEFGKLPPKKANGIPRTSVNRQELIDAAMASERDPDFAIRRAEELGYRVA